MQVLQVTPRYFPNIGGVETVVRKISEMLAMRGISVTVYSVDFNLKLLKQEKINGVIVKRFKPLVGDPFYIPEPSFIKSIREENAEIFHIHNIHTLLSFLTILLKRKNQKVVLQPHYHRFGQNLTRHLLLNIYKRAFNMLAFPYTDRIIVNSYYEKKIFREDFPRFKNVLMIPEGIAINELRSVKWDPEKSVRILYVGGLRRYKNVDKLIKAFARLVKMEKGEFKLVIVGSGSELERLVNLAKKLGVMNLIEWKQNLSRRQLLLEYSKASVFVLLSPLESFSRVVYEALVIGVPTVVLNFGATANLVKDKLAIGVNTLNPDEITNAVLKALQRTKPRTIKDQKIFLEWEEYLDKILEVYYAIL